MTGKRIFLSHSKRDAKWSRCLKEQLEAAGLEVFFDENIDDGREWSPEIENGLTQATHFFLVVSPESMASRWVRTEFHAFHARMQNEPELRIIPVMRAAAPLSLLLSMSQRQREILTPTSYGPWLAKVVKTEFGSSASRELPMPCENPHWDDEIRRIPEKLFDAVLDEVETVLKLPGGSFTLVGLLQIPSGFGAGFSQETRCQANVGFISFAGAHSDQFEAAIKLHECLSEKLYVESKADQTRLTARIAELQQAKAAATPAPERLVAYRAEVRNWRPDLMRQRFRIDGPSDSTLDQDQRELDEVYVELAISGSRPTKPDSGSIPWRTLEQLLALEPGPNSPYTGHYVLRGHPGTGKSTALRATARRMARKSEGRIPVYFSLPEFASDDRTWMDFVARQHLKDGGDELRDALDPRHEGKGLAIFCDGLDEVVRDESRNRIREILRQMARSHRLARIVVATRKIGYVPFAPSQYVEVDLVPLSRELQRELLRNWFKSGNRVESTKIPSLVERVMSDLDSGGATLRELREVPLLLSFIAMLYEDRHDEPKFAVAGTRAKLLGEILDHLVAGRHRDPRLEIQPERGTRVALGMLAKFATEFEAKAGNGVIPTRGDLEEHLVEIWNSPALRSVKSQWKDAEKKPNCLGFLRAIRNVTGILGGGNEAKDPWVFPHRTLREALTAEFLAGDPTAERMWKTLARGYEAQWAEPFALWVAQKEDPDRHLLHMKRTNPALALRALASVDRVLPETVLEILDLTRLDSDDRDRAVLAIPEKLSDPEKACRVLGQLAAQASESRILWHIDQALQAIRATDSGTADWVRQAEARLFEHPHFGREFDPRWLVVPGHPENPYWVRVDAGTAFTMGSPESEPDRHNDEGPQHVVTFARGYEIAAVPITREIWSRFRLDATAGDEPNLPIVEIDWFDATMFCRWATIVGAQPLELRLPSEAEWECACRAGTTTAYSFGDESLQLGDYAWYEENSSDPRPVATRLGNRWKLFDGHGNVMNWCADPWHGDYKNAPSDGSVWTDSGSSNRVIRGGSWHGTARRCRSSYRSAWLPDARSGLLGFRPARFVTDPLHSFTPPLSQEPPRADTAP